jgi:hypothetical protein
MKVNENGLSSNYAICKQVREVEEQLYYLTKEETKEAREVYTSCLAKITSLCRSDGSHVFFKNYHKNNFADRLLAFKKLQRTLIRVQARPHLQPVDSQKETVENLEKKIKDLKFNLKTLGRMPVRYGKALYADRRQKLQDVQVDVLKRTNVEQVESELFHFILDKEKEKNLKGIDIKSLSGRDPVRGVLSFISLIKELIKRNETSSTAQTLLKELEFTLKLAQKAALCTTSSNHSDYYRALASVTPVLDHFHQIKENLEDQNQNISDSKIVKQLSRSEKKCWHRFKQSSSFNVEKGNVSAEIILHDLCWDILKRLEMMEANQYMILPLGTTRHFVIIEIRCKRLDNGQKSFDLIVFNTGDKADSYHLMEEENDEEFIKPLSIHSIKPQALKYSLFEELFRIYMKEKSMSAFYNALLTFAKTSHLTIDKNSEEWYLAQKQGTCVHAALEVVCLLHLKNEERELFHLVKGETMMRKQELIVKKLSTVSQKRFKQIKQEKKSQDTSSISKPTSRLNQSSQLLKLAKQYFIRLSNKNQF